MNRRRLMLGTSVLAALASFQGPGAACRGQEPKAVFREPAAAVWAVTFSPDSRLLATLDSEGVANLWDVTTGRLKYHLNKNVRLAVAAAFSPNGKTVAWADDGGAINLVELSTGKVVAHWEQDDCLVWSLTFSPDGKTLASVASVEETVAVTLWDVGRGKKKRTRRVSGAWATAFSPDGKLFACVRAVAEEEQVVELWDAARVQRRSTLDGRRGVAWALAFSRDSRVLACQCGKDLEEPDESAGCEVRLCEVASGKIRAAFKFVGRCSSLAFHPAGRLLAAAADKKVLVLDLAGGKARHVLGGHTKRVMSVAFSPDGRLIASGSLDGTVRLWDVRAVLKARK